MSRTVVAVTVATAFTLALAGCGGEDDADRSTDDNDSLRAAGDVASEQAAAEAVLAEPGEYVELTDNIRVVVTAFAYEENEGDGWFSITTRVEHSGEMDATMPDYAIICANSNERGSHYGTGTLDEDDLGPQLPAGSFREGTRHLIAPTDERSIGGEAAPCEGPAFVEIEPTGIFIDTETTTARYEIPTEVLEQLGQ